MLGLFRRRQVEIINKDDLVVTMTRIVELLRDSGFTAQADAIRKPLQYLYLNDNEKFLKYLNTVDIWGGSGAAWEVAFTSREIEKEFETCFIKLFELMERTGIKISKANSVTKLFKKDLLRD